MHLSKENLNLYRIVSTDGTKVAFTGVHVDPRARVTAATNGSMLVEVTAPPGGPPAADGKESKPFLLPAKVAQEVAKTLGDQAKVRVGFDQGRPVFLPCDGKKAAPISFKPLEAVYPDYQKFDLWGGKGDPATLTCDSEYVKDVLRAAATGKTVRLTLGADRIRFESEPRDVSMAVGQPAPGAEGRTLTFNSEFLRQVFAAAAIGKSVTLLLWGDRLRIESKKDDGQSARGVLMCCGQPAPSRAEAPAPSKGEAPARVEKPGAAPKPEPAAPAGIPPTSTPAPAPTSIPASNPVSSRRFRPWGRFRAPFVPKNGETVPKPPSEKQRMLYTYFLRRHGQEITPEILASTDFVGKIEELKKGLSYDQEFATWPQWKKVNYLLLERQAEPKTVCEVLNAIKDIKTASEAIASLVKKAEPAAA